MMYFFSHTILSDISASSFYTTVSLLVSLFLFTMLATSTSAQQINFSLTVEDGIIATPLQHLNFNEKQAVINNEDHVVVDLLPADFHAMGLIEIIAAAEYEIDVTFNFPSVLMPPEVRFDQIQTVPITFRWAYSNNSGASCNQTELQNNATIVPDMFSAARFPVKQHVGPTPGLPPTPMHGGIVNADPQSSFRREAGLVCLFIAGEITVPNVPSDVYSSEIHVDIRYSQPISGQ